MWRVGNKLAHPFNPELGIGFVQQVEGRYLTVYFPTAEREITLAAEGSGLEPLYLETGAYARVIATGEEVQVTGLADGVYTLADGREIDDAEIWPVEPANTPIERIANLKPDRLRSFRNRMEGYRLGVMREAGGLGSFLGGRIDLFPHQLHTAMKAANMDQVRWMLADEVGLGKTIVACLILSALVRTGRAKRALIIAPSMLTVQWLGELYRKFHQIFVLLDPARIASVDSDFGAHNNPFDVHPFGVISMDLLEADPVLAETVLGADLDLVVVDEAHRLANPVVDAAIAPIIAHAKHALLLTATPLQADRAGFHHLLDLLHPGEFGDFETFSKTVEAGGATFACTSAVRREDIGGLPPRKPVAVDLGPTAADVKRDPRARWIADQIPKWLAAREKALVFVHNTKTLEKLKAFLEGAARSHISVFHEELTVGQRDIEVARFRETNTPVLLCSEAGSEGRNFQFCDRQVHYDLPLDPIGLEQRIGRLDRIGRTKDVEIVYFRCEKAKPDIARLYEVLDLFSRPSAGLDTALRGTARLLAEADAKGHAISIEDIVAAVESERGETIQDLPRVLYSDQYRAEQAEEILALVPEELETSMRKFCLGAANDLGLKIVEKGGEALYYLEMGTSLTVESLPGVPDESRWLGTFSREEANDKDEFEFFASGHALVEGLLAELEDGPRGRAALFEVPDAEEAMSGLFCIYKYQSRYVPVVCDTRGQVREGWGEKVLAGLGGAKSVKPEDWGLDDRWPDAIRLLASEIEESVPEDAVLEAAAFFRFLPTPAA